MTENGAKLWIYFMKQSLNEYKEVLDEINENIYESILDYCNFLMFVYSKKFKFSFEYNDIKRIKAKL